MADYQAVLRKAVSGLEKNSGEARRAIYEKARNALVNQLKAIDPPLSPSEITKQRLGLEEAIRKVEAEAASAALVGRRLSETTAGSEAPAGAAERPEAAAERPEAGAESQGEADGGGAEAKPSRLVVEEAVPAEESGAMETGAAARAVEGGRRAPDAREEPERPATESRIPPQGPAEAAPEAVSRTAPVIAPEISGETAAEDGVAGEPVRVAPPVASAPAGPGGLEGGLQGENAEGSGRPAEGVAPPPMAGPGDVGGYRPESGEGRRISLVLLVILVLIGIGAGVIWWQREALVTAFNQAFDLAGGVPREAAEPSTETPSGKITDRLLDDGEPSTPEASVPKTGAAETGGTETGGPETVVPEEGADVPREPGGTGAGEPGAGEPEAAGTEASGPGTGDTGAAAPETGVAGTEAGEAGANGTNASQGKAEAANVAQQAILYEEATGEDPNKGFAFSGRVAWELASEPGSEGQPPQTVIYGTVEIPDRGLKMAMTIRKNTDTALPASHLVELLFDIPKDFPGGGIASVPGLILKPSEQARGEALRGAAARVANGFFWVALSSKEKDVKANVDLLRERSWFDIPILYDSGKRAILTIEKGAPGQRVFARAFRTWNER